MVFIVKPDALPRVAYISGHLIKKKLVCVGTENKLFSH